MSSLPARIVVGAVIFLVALGGALALMRGSDSTKREDVAAPAGASSKIWKVGDTWTIKVRQDAGQITPDGKPSYATVPFNFEVVTAPSTKGGSWVVRVMQEGAEGPFAAGWQLQYQAKGSTMVLHRVAIGKEPPLAPELATIVLGPQFPYEVTYSKPPKDATLDADKLLERSTLPPSSLPNSPGEAPNATPPATAPPLPGDAIKSNAPARHNG